MGARRILARSVQAQQKTDGELVTRVVEGDRECYSMLVRRYQDDLYRHARGMGLDHDTCEDLVQDAFVKAYSGLEKCRNRDRFRCWVFRILRNRCLDHLKNVRRNAVPLDALEQDRGAPATYAAEDELRSALAAALDSLPAMLREAFLLKHQADYTYDEMAEITECSVSAVKMRVHRAREALRSYLLEEGVTAT